MENQMKDICRKMNKDKLFRGIKQTIPQKNVEFVPWDFIEEPNY
jgi:hypothetical protein